jgi:hypothetical protein
MRVACMCAACMRVVTQSLHSHPHPPPHSPQTPNTHTATSKWAFEAAIRGHGSIESRRAWRVALRHPRDMRRGGSFAGRRHSLGVDAMSCGKESRGNDRDHLIPGFFPLRLHPQRPLVAEARSIATYRDYCLRPTLKNYQVKSKLIKSLYESDLIPKTTNAFNF